MAKTKPRSLHKNTAFALVGWANNFEKRKARRKVRKYEAWLAKNGDTAEAHKFRLDHREMVKAVSETLVDFQKRVTSQGTHYVAK